jgi:hypothetical protein
MTVSDFRKYGIEYGFGNNRDRWTLSVMATSPEDAMARVKAAAAWGECYTPEGIAMEVPAYCGPFVRLLVWLRNLAK